MVDSSNMSTTYGRLIASGADREERGPDLYIEPTREVINILRETGINFDLDAEFGRVRVVLFGIVPLKVIYDGKVTAN